MNIPQHGKYKWLPLLYKIVKDFKQKKIIELGTGRGKTWDVDNLISLNHLDFYDWIKLPVEDRNFDILYFDINNNGTKLLDLYENVKGNIDNGSIVLFEGGSVERDRNGVIVPGAQKMNDVKDIVGYKVLTKDIKYSFSIIYNDKLHNLEYL